MVSIRMLQAYVNLFRDGKPYHPLTNGVVNTYFTKRQYFEVIENPSEVGDEALKNLNSLRTSYVQNIEAKTLHIVTSNQAADVPTFIRQYYDIANKNFNDTQIKQEEAWLNKYLDTVEQFNDKSLQYFNQDQVNFLTYLDFQRNDTAMDPNRYTTEIDKYSLFLRDWVYITEIMNVVDIISNPLIQNVEISNIKVVNPMQANFKKM